QSSRGTKRNCNDNSPKPSKDRKTSGKQSSRSSTSGISDFSIPRNTKSIQKYKETDSHNIGILENSTRFEIETIEALSTMSDRAEMEANEDEESVRHSKGILEDSTRFKNKSEFTATGRGEREAKEGG
ncbi:unnamed protein product, partial [Meganyctiphanes norvegica]